MNDRLFSLCTPSPSGFTFCREFRSREFRRAPFALYAPSSEAAHQFLSHHLPQLAGVILIQGEHLSSEEVAPLVSQITISSSMLPYLADFAAHQLMQLARRISSEDRHSFLALENERLELNNQRASDEFSLFRDSLIHEIEERRAAERQLAESEELLRLIMSSTVEAIYGVNTEGLCTFANESCLKLLGYDHIGELLRRNMHDLIHHSTPDGLPMPIEECRIFRAFRDGTGVTVNDEYFWRRDGSSFPVEYSSYPIRKDGDVVGAVVTWRDITQRRRTEKDREKMEKQLLHAQKLESLGVLAGGIAHEFNNILMAIIGNADLALMRVNKESSAVENLHRIGQAAARAADLAQQMLDYSGRGQFVVEKIDLNALLEDMLHMLEASISNKAVLRFNLHSPLPSVEADATQMRQIILKLVINASEAIGDNSGEIAITTGCMECDRSYLKDVLLDENLIDGRYVYLEIADSGCGMDRDTLSKLFDPFFTTKFAGRGLGMAAVLGIVRGHKGAIKVSSEPDIGTTFKILLPASTDSLSS